MSTNYAFVHAPDSLQKRWCWNTLPTIADQKCVMCNRLMYTAGVGCWCHLCDNITLFRSLICSPTVRVGFGVYAEEFFSNVSLWLSGSCTVFIFVQIAGIFLKQSVSVVMSIVLFPIPPSCVHYTAEPLYLRFCSVLWRIYTWMRSTPMTDTRKQGEAEIANLSHDNRQCDMGSILKLLFNG